MKNIAIGCDPNAEEQKQALIQHLRQEGSELTDMGSTDPIYAHTAIKVAESVASGKYDCGCDFPVNANGEIEIPKKHLAEGYYIITEIQAPEGYILDPTRS